MPVQRYEYYIMRFTIKTPDKDIFNKYRVLFKNIFNSMGVLDKMEPPKKVEGQYIQSYILSNPDIAYDEMKKWGRSIAANGYFIYRGRKIVIPPNLSMEVNVEKRSEEIVRISEELKNIRYPKRSIREEWEHKYGMKTYTVYIESTDLEKLKKFTKMLINTLEQIPSYISLEKYYASKREEGPTRYIAKIIVTTNKRGYRIIQDLKETNPSAMLVKEGITSITRERMWEEVM